MSGTVRARVKCGHLELLEKVDIPDNTEVWVTIIETPGARSADGLRRSAGGWKGLIDTDWVIHHLNDNTDVITRLESLH